MASESEVPDQMSYRKPNVDALLRDLTDFVFYVPTTGKLVSLEDISTRPIAGSGTVLSPSGDKGVSIALPEVTEWFVGFGVTREECAIWIKTPFARFVVVSQ